MRVLGISCWYHDAAAALVVDGDIVAAAQEERFSRRKHDADFPANAALYCLAEGGIEDGDLDAVVFYDKPVLKFHRILETHLGVAPRGLRSFTQAVPLWLRSKLWVTPRIHDHFAALGFTQKPPVVFGEHHESHGASAFFPSPFERAAVLTLDGVGEWSTATLGVGEGNRLRLIEEIRFPHSLGLLYSAFTYFCGFKVNSGEYKLMGLAPYGKPVFADVIRKRLIDLRDDGSFRLDMRYFDYLGGLTMTARRFDALFGGPPRRPESPITQREMDLAASVQAVTEDIVLRIARHARETTGERHLCLAGGVALNCVANGELLRSGLFDDLWIQPAAGDAGGALGAALAYSHHALGVDRRVRRPDAMQGACLGPEFDDDEIAAFLEHRGYPARRFDDPHAWAATVADSIADGQVVGLLQGRMEFGPRALGNRSILGDARSAKMQSVMNLKIKHRESFRPFAPSCLEERVEDYFELDRPSPYMLLVAPVQPSRRLPLTGDEHELDMIDRVNRPRSDLPAITHVDHSARVQTVRASTNPGYHRILKAFEERTGEGIVINTSFNVRGEPIVCTPEDAYRCFMRTQMDRLVLGSFVLDKSAQPGFEDTERWQETFQLD